MCSSRSPILTLGCLLTEHKPRSVCANLAPMIYRKRKRLPDGVIITYPHWHYKFERDGRTIHRNTKQGNKQTAKELEAKHRTGIARGEAEFLPARVPTFAQFNPVLVSRTGKIRSTQFYADRMKALLAFGPLANARLTAIDADLIEKYVASRRGVDSPATINRSLATLRKALRLAVDRKPPLLQGVPKITMELGEHHREFILLPQHQQAYLDACPDPLRDVAALILETGLRLGEALNLTWPDISEGKLHVLKGKSKKAQRSITLTAIATGILQRRKLTSTVKWIFPNEAETGPAINTTLGHQHARVRDRLHLHEEFVLHSLRHTALTRFAASGMDVFTLKRVAGHASVVTSERYVHPTDEAMDSAFKRFEVVSLSAHPAENRL